MGARPFLGRAIHMEEPFQLSSGGCISQEPLLGSITATELSTAGAARAASSQLAARGSCWEGQVVLVPPLTQQGPAGAAVLSAGTLGQMPWPQLAQHSWEERGQQMASLAVPCNAPLLGLGVRAFWWRGNGHGPAGKGLASLMAAQQLGVWLNCSAVAKEPRCSQETDGCTQ